MNVFIGAQRIVSLVCARRNCERHEDHAKWYAKHDFALKRCMEELMPSGCGFDHGTSMGPSDETRLTFVTSFHHMNDTGMYDGWTDHVVTARASLLFGVELSVSGRNRNDIKAFISDTFRLALERIGEINQKDWSERLNEWYNQQENNQ